MSPAKPRTPPVATNPVRPDPLDALPERRIQRHYDALGGAPGAATSGLEQSGVGDRIRYQNGAIYVGPNTEPAWVYGDIGQRYDEFGAGAGWLGLPMIDETGTPDGRGRYNHFEHGSIYWTPTTRAFEVHGAIRDRWASLGWETGFLGYPVTDEMGTPDGRGRFNRFEGGSIYWSPTTGAFELHSPALPATITGHGDIVLEDGVAAGGWADIVLNSDGAFTYSGHLHDSGALDYTDSVVCVVIALSTSTAYTFIHNGRLRGTFTPGSRDDDWSETGSRSDLVDAWIALCAGNQIFFPNPKVDWDPEGWAETIKDAYPYVQTIVALL